MPEKRDSRGRSKKEIRRKEERPKSAGTPSDRKKSILG